VGARVCERRGEGERGRGRERERMIRVWNLRLTT